MRDVFLITVYRDGAQDDDRDPIVLDMEDNAIQVAKNFYHTFESDYRFDANDPNRGSESLIGIKDQSLIWARFTDWGDGVEVKRLKLYTSLTQWYADQDAKVE
jgi:hypothetical protein